jgi:hypothetical protein
MRVRRVFNEDDEEVQDAQEAETQRPERQSDMRPVGCWVLGIGFKSRKKA